MLERQYEILERVLKHRDPNYHSLIFSCPKVCIYPFNGEWQEATFEGPLYLYNTISSTILIVFNRKKNDVFKITFDNSEYVFEKSLILKTNGNIYSIWFYDERDFIKAKEVFSGLETLKTVSNDFMEEFKKLIN